MVDLTFAIIVFLLPISTKDDMRTLFEAAGNIQRVKVLPAREDRDITLGYASVIVVIRKCCLQ